MTKLGKDIQSSVLPTIREDMPPEELVRVLKQYRQLIDSILRLNKIYALEMEIGDGTNYLDVGVGGVVTLVGTAKRILTLRPAINMAAVGQNEKPTMAEVGAFQGFSMPIWATPAQDDEELFFRSRVPYRWDAASDITFKILVCLAGAEDIGDDFKFQFSWEHATITGAIAATTNDVVVQTEVVTGRVAQYSTYLVSFTIDYNVDGVGSEIVAGNILGGRLRRVAVTGTEVTNEIIVLDWVIEYQIDKLYGTW